MSSRLFPFYEHHDEGKSHRITSIYCLTISQAKEQIIKQISGENGGGGEKRKQREKIVMKEKCSNTLPPPQTNINKVQ